MVLLTVRGNFFSLFIMSTLCVPSLIMYLRIMNSNTCKKYRTIDIVDRRGYFDIINKTGRFDNSRKYVIHDFIYISANWSRRSINSSVCVATQTSVEYLFRLIEMSQSWQGLISAAVYVPSTEFHVTQLFLHLLIEYFPSMKENVSFHFVYPVMQPPQLIPELLNWTSTNCSQWRNCWRQLRSFLPETFSDKKTQPYPQNHLRNVARKNCPTRYIYMIDVDIIPQKLLAQNLNFLRDIPACEKCAFVIPTYEVYENNTQLPTSKSALMKLVKQNLAQPFHKKVFIRNQYAINHSKWENAPESNDFASAYLISNYQLYFEPFYVAIDAAPPHDERFVGYGFTRNTQVFEMHMAGYKFMVLNNAFAMHRGFNLKYRHIDWREKQIYGNSKLFNTFEKEIYARYTRKMPTFKKKSKSYVQSEFI